MWMPLAMGALLAALFALCLAFVPFCAHVMTEGNGRRPIAPPAEET